VCGVEGLVTVAGADPVTLGVLVDDTGIAGSQTPCGLGFPGVGESSDTCQLGCLGVGGEQAEQPAGFD
jgi:hypothetical protein